MRVLEHMLVVSVMYSTCSIDQNVGTEPISFEGKSEMLLLVSSSTRLTAQLEEHSMNNFSEVQQTIAQYMDLFACPSLRDYMELHEVFHPFRD